jgi:cob(I)alamin adenosyltransferase
MKIYTKSGDQGDTGLLGAVRVSKDHIAVQVCGELDETNCAIGIALAEELDNDLRQSLSRIQAELFVLGARIASIFSEKRQHAGVDAAQIAWLEQKIDELEPHLPALDAFILPGGCRAGAALHLARTICRRAERTLVTMSRELGLGAKLSNELIYLNRLSDLIFVMARTVNHQANRQEQKWLPDT